MTPGSAAGGAAVNGDGRASARRRSWRVVELLLATLVLFVVAVGAGAGAARADWDSSQQQGSSGHQQDSSGQQSAHEAQFLGLANGQRNSVGSAALAPDPALRDIARWWAARMAATSDIFHNYNLPDEVHDDWSKLGENVGMGWSVDDLHKAFVRSQSHYQNLVDPSYGSVGIGVAYNSDGKIFVVFDFMALQPPTAAAAPQTNAQASAGDGMTLVRPRAAAAVPPPPVAHPVVHPPAAVVPAVLVEEDPAPVPAPPPAPLRAPSPALSGVLTELRALDHHAAAPRARATTTTTTTAKPARRGSREATVETKDAQTWTKPKPATPKPDRQSSPSEAAKLWLTPSYCDPNHPKGSC